MTEEQRIIQKQIEEQEQDFVQPNELFKAQLRSRQIVMRKNHMKEVSVETKEEAKPYLDVSIK